jgi:mRNA interferase RelE/StbE
VTDHDDETPYTLRTTPTVRRQLTEELPESVAAAALEFITGPLLDNPQRVGKPLSAPLQDRRSARRGTYRIIYRIENDSRIVTVLLVSHRRDAYRPR